MFGTVFLWLNNAWEAVMAWFSNILQAVGLGLGGVLAIIFAISVLRFIILPFLKGGVGSSDPVKFADPPKKYYGRPRK